MGCGTDSKFMEVGVGLKENALPDHIGRPLACDIYVDGAVDDPKVEVDLVFGQGVLSHG